MNWLSVLYTLLLAQHNPAITVDKARVTYGNSLTVTITNPTAAAITYYLDLDVLVGEYWGPADEDILNPTREKLVRYTTQSLKPGQKTVIHYDTKVLSENYAKDFHTYRMTLHCTNSPHTTEEDIITSTKFEIVLPKAALSKGTKK